jgi:predicted GNAT superfamily acetyltransferase
VDNVLNGRPRAIAAATERIAIPANIRDICRDEPLKAEEIQANVREQFSAHIASGRAAIGFEFNAEQGSYLMERYED